MKNERLVFISLSILFLLILVSIFVVHFTSDLELPEYIVEEEKEEETPPEGEENPETATCSPVNHALEWRGYGFGSDETFRAIFSVCEEDYLLSRENRKRSGFRRVSGGHQAPDYRQMVDHDKLYLQKAIGIFETIASNRGMTETEKAEMVVSFVQYIDYVLVHSESCDFWIRQCGNGNRNFMCEWHNGNIRMDNARFGRNPCAENIDPGGVQAPLEFLFNLKADCDTRTTFLYAVLKEMGYDVVILNSDIHAHSVLGINLGIASWGKSYFPGPGNRKKYLVWETTSRSLQPGIYPGRFRPAEWYIALI